MFDLNSAYQQIDGMEWVLDGVHGHLSVERILMMTEVVHNPSKRGQLSKTYQAHRRILGDDYVTTITANDAVMEQVFLAAQLQFELEEAS